MNSENMNSRKVDCPKCKSPTSDFSLTSRLIVNRCQVCNVVWFDKDELGLWFHFDETATIASVKMPSSLDAPLVPSSPVMQNSTLECPRCSPSEVLAPLQLRDQIIYRCQTCLGHLVTMDGLKKFKEYKPVLSNKRIVESGARIHSSSQKIDRLDLRSEPRILVKQKRELVELIGIETKNKYEIYGHDSRLIAFCSEKGSGVFNFLSRTFFGHWRTFQLDILGPDQSLQLKINHPFRFLLPCFEVSFADGKQLGLIQQKFTIFSKEIEVSDFNTGSHFLMKSPFWRPWRFPFCRDKVEVATVEKKFSGIFSEIFTDKDNFVLTYLDPRLGNEDRALLLSAAIFIDLAFFEKKASS
jgi:uncharacterized protein YxjI